jgi:hypothetical protein
MANEEFIPKATPVGLASYPMKTHLLNVSSIEHQHKPIKQTRSHDRPSQRANIPPNTALGFVNEKLKKSASADDILTEPERRKVVAETVASPLDSLYTTVDKSKVTGEKVVHKPAVPNYGAAVERNRSSVKKGIQEDKQTNDSESFRLCAVKCFSYNRVRSVWKIRGKLYLTR